MRGLSSASVIDPYPKRDPTCSVALIDPDWDGLPSGFNDRTRRGLTTDRCRVAIRMPVVDVSLTVGV
jgi:hypothetical protein